MNFQQLKYSLNEVERAGYTLTRKKVSMKDEDAWGILSNWRAAHHLPLHFLAMNLLRNAEKIDRNAIVARRLKRAPSMINKLLRDSEKSLKTMQDIGGCRAILSNLDAAEKLTKAFEQSKQKHELITKRDYNKNPQSSGYRGIHLVYKFKSEHEKTAGWNGRRIEVQIRSITQHIWATAVEIASMMLHQDLKSGQGDVQWLEFFKKMSEAMNLLDRGKSLPDKLCRTITSLSKSLEVQKQLTHYTVALKNEIDGKRGYYVLLIEGMNLSVRQYEESEDAEAAYAELESNYRNEPNTDIVLVNALPVHQLKKAYPNYFGDSQAFLKMLDEKIIVTRKRWWERYL